MLTRLQSVAMAAAEPQSGPEAALIALIMLATFILALSGPEIIHVWVDSVAEFAGPDRGYSMKRGRLDDSWEIF